MVKGQRAHCLTKADIVSRLINSFSPPSNFEITVDASLPQLLGHAIYYKLLTQLEIDETTPRNDTTQPCYLRSLVSGSADLLRIDRYVEASSLAERRGSMILNKLAQKMCGPRLLGARVTGYDVPVFRPRFEDGPVIQSMLSFVDMWWDFDHGIEDSTLKHAFMPERWGTNAQQSILDIVAEPESLLPPEPPGWRDIMIGGKISNWDNAFNRMMTRYFGNVKVQAMKGVKDAIAAYFRVVPLNEPYVRGLLIDTILNRPRPLVADNDDYEMAMALRTSVVADVNFFMPKDASWSRDVFLIHLFLTRFGVKERSYVPVSSPGRHYTYVDSKIAAGLFPGASSKMQEFATQSTRARGVNKLFEKKSDEVGSSSQKVATKIPVFETTGDTVLTTKAKNKADKLKATAEKSKKKQDAVPKQLTAAQAAKIAAKVEAQAAKDALLVLSGPQIMPVTPTLGELMNITPQLFNERRRILIRQIRKSNTAATKSKTFLHEKQKRRFIKQVKHRRTVGYGKMDPTTRFDSFETDTVGLRIVLKTAINLSMFILPITSDVKFKPKIKEPKLLTRTHKISKKVAQINAMNAELAQPFDPTLANAILAGVDEGRAKFFTGAFKKKSPQGSEHDGFESFTLTRNKYNAVTKLKFRRKWEKKRRDATSGLQDAYAALSLGSLHSCDPESWSRYLTAERANSGILHADYFGDKEREKWGMIAFRKKKSCLDRAVGDFIAKATKGESKDRPLVIGLGDAAFPPNGPRGEIAVPTSQLAAAWKRGMARERRKGRRVVMLPISERWTTKACCKCGTMTIPPQVMRTWRTKDGELRTVYGPSGRLRCCTTCTPNGKLRDRDVQAARNMFHATKALICGEARPAHLCDEAHVKKVPLA